MARKKKKKGKKDEIPPINTSGPGVVRRRLAAARPRGRASKGR
jgi:hypothetical protein